MSQTLIYLLLALALVVPVLGTIALRLLGERLSEAQVLWSALVLFVMAILSVLVLAFSNISSLTIGNVTILLPLVNPVNDPQPAPLPVEPSDLPPATIAPATPDRSPAPARATTVRTATVATTPTLTATAENTPPPPTDTATPEPASATPEPEPEPAQVQTYTVEAGDTLRSIAAQFDVSVEDLLAANDLTPAEADALRPGQDLVIP